MPSGVKIVLIILTVICFILIILFALKCRSTTPAVPGGISEMLMLEIGGIKQSVTIRGEKKNNPVLLYLHGGPGTTELIPFRLTQKKLEKYFTIVLWEQRGTGKSYSPAIPASSMTIEQFVSDTHELTEYLLKRFGKEKLLLVGHSWGTALGLLSVQRYPECYYAYVGTGQEAAPARSERLTYEYLLTASAGNKKAHKELLDIDTPEPYPTIDAEGKWFGKVQIHRKWLIALGGELYRKKDYSSLFNFNTILAPEYTWGNFLDFAYGSSFSLKTMWPQVLALDFFDQIPKVEVPVFFMQGDHDYNTSAKLAREYFDVLQAPAKEYVNFSRSGHHPQYEEPQKFQDYLVEHVLPLCR